MGKGLMEEATTLDGKFRSIEILYEWLEKGHEYKIAYKDKEYFILNGYDDNDRLDLRVLIIDVDQDIEFSSVDDLFDNFIIDGKSFREFIFEVNVLEEY